MVPKYNVLNIKVFYAVLKNNQDAFRVKAQMKRIRPQVGPRLVFGTGAYPVIFVITFNFFNILKKMGDGGFDLQVSTPGYAPAVRRETSTNPA